MSINNSLQTFLAKYRFGPTIGEGGFSKIVLCERNNIIFAAKIIDGIEAFNCDIDVETECELLRRVDHPNIIKLHDFFLQKPFNLILITEVINGKNMYQIIFDRLRNKLFPSEQNTKLVMVNLLRGLEYLHSKSIVHRDVHPGNILVQLGQNHEMLKIVLGDFGMAAAGRKLKPVLCGIPTYMAPEMNGRQEYDHKIDVYAAGWNMIYFFTDLHTITLPARQLIDEMLRENPQNRISAAGALRQRWFQL